MHANATLAPPFALLLKAALLLLLSQTAAALAAQAPAHPGAPTLQPRTVTDRAIVIDAVVPRSASPSRHSHTDSPTQAGPSAGPVEPAADPSAPSLTVTDNGRPIPPAQLHAVDEHSPESPAQLLFVLDLLNTPQQDIIRAEAALASFLRQRAGVLAQPTSVLFVSSSAAAASTPPTPSAHLPTPVAGRRLSLHRLSSTTDGNTLAHDVEAYSRAVTAAPDLASAAAVADRVRLSLQALSTLAQAEAPVSGAKVVVWLSPGWPFVARSQAKSSAELFDSVVYFSDSMRNARLLLSMVDPSGITEQPTADTNAFQPASGATLRMPVVNTAVGQSFFSSYVQGVQKPERANPNDLTLQVLALQSGGLVLQQNNNIADMIARCASDVANLTGVSFLPAATPGTVQYHQIRVTGAGRLQPLRARTGYYSR